jgi:DNA modification methylase
MLKIELKKGKLICGDSASRLKDFPDDYVDLVVTSPPYDDLRSYKGFHFDFETIARELARTLKPGGIIVWNVADATIDGTETLTSFKQAIFFKEVCGLLCHDTMLFVKNNPVPGNHGPRYRGCFEYMFAFSKGVAKTFNPIELKPQMGSKITERFRLEKDGRKPLWDNEILGDKNKHKVYEDSVYSRAHSNIFFYTVGSSTVDKNHPATFPDQLAEDQIRTWTNPGDLVLDPFSGSGTTARMAAMLDRRYIGIEISQEYLEASIPLIREAENFEPIFAKEEPRFEAIPVDFD